jgi:hypothetical protein
MQLLGVGAGVGAGVGVCVEPSSLASPRLTSHHQIRTKSIVVHLIHCRRLFSAVLHQRYLDLNIFDHFDAAAFGASLSIMIHRQHHHHHTLLRYAVCNLFRKH